MEADPRLSSLQPCTRSLPCCSRDDPLLFHKQVFFYSYNSMDNFLSYYCFRKVCLSKTLSRETKTAVQLRMTGSQAGLC